MSSPTGTAQPASAIDDFVRESRALNGREIRERPQWHTAASGDAIRHFAYGSNDHNPLWLDAVHAAASGHARPLAPPAFVLSVLYPVLHGARIAVPMINLISDLGVEWQRPVVQDDRLRAVSRQRDVYEGRQRNGHRVVCVVADTTYSNQNDDVVAIATATLAWIERRDAEVLVEREVPRYEEREIARLTAAIRSQSRRGRLPFAPDEVVVGREIPELTYAPLTIADLIGWQAAIGPFYRAGDVIGLTADADAPSVGVHPLTGWAVTGAMQHDDALLTRQLGLPRPFENGTMRLARIVPMLTNWMGDGGFLRRIQIHLREPVLYGEVARYHATITERVETDTGVVVKLRIGGTNQLGATTTNGTAELLIPWTSFRDPDPASVRPPHRAADTDNRRLLRGWNDSPRCASRGQGVEALVEAHARRYPEAIAVRRGATELSYDELNRRANRLAHHLRFLGVGRGVRAVIYMRRTAQAVVAILAAAKAGVTRMCVDPAHSGDRVGALGTAIGATLLLTDAIGAAIALPQGLRIVRCDGDGSTLPGACDDDVDCSAGPDDLSYLLFTSGSVSAPKAIAVSRASLGVAVESIRRPLGVERTDVYLHSASFAFSASERQLWLPLSTGATLVLADAEERTDPVALFETICARGVTVWDTMPSWLRACLERLQTLAPEHRAVLLDNRLRKVMVTGEPLSWELARQASALLGSRLRLINLYSQSETVGTTCAFEVGHLPDAAHGTVPIGRPVDYTRACVLDEALRPVAIGEVGEICIGGDRLASGYFHQPGLSAQRFVRDPFADDAKARLYRSGDLGRVGADGILEYVGRADERIKLRGFRIDPEEVEAALVAHPHIREAAVRCDDSGAEPRLVAYLSATEKHLPISALRDHLNRSLPPYMLPAVYHWMERLPRTPSGKLDRSALPTLGPAGPAIHDVDDSDDSIEHRLAAIWAAVLNLGRVGLDDDFFEIGGDSLSAVTAIVQTERLLARALALEWIYRSPTVRSFARRLQLPPPPSAADSMFTLAAGEHPGIYFVAGGGGHPFGLRRLANLLESGRACYGLQLPGLDGASVPRDRIEAVAAELVEQIRCRQPTGPYHLVGYSFGGLVVYEMARQLRHGADAVGLVALLDTPGPNAFRRRPLLERLRVHRSRLATRGVTEGFQYLGGVAIRTVQRQLGSARSLPSLSSDDSRGSPLMRTLLAVRSAKRTAGSRYRPGPYAGRVWLFRATPAEWMQLSDVDPQYGWGALCAGGVEVRLASGSHSSLLEEPHVQLLAGELKAALDEACRVP